jgi:hypothetical protein
MNKPEDRLLRNGERPDLEAFMNYIREMEKESPRGVVALVANHWGKDHDSLFPAFHSPAQLIP